MMATIQNNHHWEGQRGTVLKETETTVTVRIADKYNGKLVYDVKFPRKQVKFEKEVALA
jgi:hypothetical protein